ncbi:MAG: NAD+ synthase [Micavibrio sp.]|nr:NAD+ synthase [Micavibrio sp.]
MKLTLIQENPIVGDIQGNIALVKKHWQNAESDLLIFSELFICGYPPEDLILRDDFITDIEVAMQDLQAFSQNQNAAILIGTPVKDHNGLYNATLTIHKGKIIHQCYKRELPNYGVFDEKRLFTPATDASILDFKGVKIGIQICEDIWFTHQTNQLNELGAELHIVLNGSPYTIDKKEQRLELAKAISRPMIYVNQIGGQDELVFDGGSFALNSKGEMVCALPSFETNTATIEFDKDFNNTPIRSLPHDSLSELYTALVLGLKDYIRKNGFRNGVILGMSGGIDSALSAAIAADALGADKVRAIMMPSPYTSQESLEDAAACAKALGISYEIIPIQIGMTALEQSIEDLKGLAHENMQSRLRGLILMSLSNTTGEMVLTTGNKSEVAVGYSTLYGDMCGGFNALKDIYKTEVYALAHWRNSQSQVIPMRIITKAPTAELRDNQKDQDSLPAYEILDGILTRLIEQNLDIETIVAQGYNKDDVEKTWILLNRAEYKRRQAAPGVKITSKSFGRDRRYPITNKYKG